MDGWMHGCMDAWMHGCMDAWMHGCMDACVRACVRACAGVAKQLQDAPDVVLEGCVVLGRDAMRPLHVARIRTFTGPEKGVPKF